MINFDKLFTDYKIDHTGKRNRRWQNVWCPYCADSYNHYQLGFSEKDGICSCWKCGWHPTEQALSIIIGLPEKDIKPLLSQYSVVRTEEKRNKFENKKLIFPGLPFTKQEEEYLKSRHFNPKKLQQKFGVMGGGVVDRRWSYRILIPFYFHNEIISWTGRSILSKEVCDSCEIQRYYNLSNEESVLNPKDYWFNSDNAQKDSVIIVEGPMDALRMEEDCICGWGSSIKEKQKLYLAKNYRKIYLLFDNDSEEKGSTGQKKSKQLKLDLESLGMEVENIGFMLQEFNKKDPGELTYSEVREIKERIQFL